MADQTVGNLGMGACFANVFPLNPTCGYDLGDPIPQVGGLLEVEATWEREAAEEKFRKDLSGGLCYNFTLPGYEKYINLRFRFCSVCATTQVLWFDAVALTDAAGDVIGAGYKIASQSTSSLCSTTPTKKLGVELFQPIVRSAGFCSTESMKFRKHIFPMVTDITNPSIVFTTEEASYVEFSGQGYSNSVYNYGPLAATSSPTAAPLGADIAYAWMDMPDGWTMPSIPDCDAPPVADQASV